MTKQQTQHNDKDLAYLFEHFEAIFSDKTEFSADRIATGTDFKVFSGFFIGYITDVRLRLEDADDAQLLSVCGHMYNLMDWIRLIVENRSQSFSDAFEHIFQDTFGDAHIAQHLYDESFRKWINDKYGQYTIGANSYNILDGQLYYRDRFRNWYVVDELTAFDVQPTKEQINDASRTERLESEYKATWYDDILNRWEEEQHQGILPDDFMRYDLTETSPEAYFDFTLQHVKDLLENPVSITELERWYGGTIPNLEDTVKLLYMVLEEVKMVRSKDKLIVYLLRDCMTFYETHKTLDLLCSEETDSDQLLIGRKLLSNAPDLWGYYIVILEILYDVHERIADDFSAFYTEFARLLDLFVASNAAFKNLVADLATYIEHHTKTDTGKIVIFDAGFQGTINLLIKYIIDRHISIPEGKESPAVDIKVAVGAEWSMKMFGHRAGSDHFSYLNRVQMLARSDELYHYKFGSFDSSSVTVTMGEERWQRKAAVELVVMVMIAKLQSV